MLTRSTSARWLASRLLVGPEPKPGILNGNRVLPVDCAGTSWACAFSLPLITAAADGGGTLPLFAFGAGTGTGTGSATAAIGPQPSRHTPRRRAGLRISLSARYPGTRIGRNRLVPPTIACAEFINVARFRWRICPAKSPPFIDRANRLARWRLWRFRGPGAFCPPGPEHVPQKACPGLDLG